MDVPKNIQFDLGELRKNWRDPIVPRKAAEIASCGLICAKSMANLDSQGRGPKNAFRIGKQTVYPAEDFFDWLVSRARPVERRKRLELNNV